MSTITTPGADNALGYQQITDLSAVVTLTVPEYTRYCVIQAEAQDVRYRDDGTGPTSSVGMPLAAGAFLFYTGDPTRLKFIESTSGAKLNILYYSGKESNI